MIDLKRGLAIDLVLRLCKGVFSISAADWVFCLLIILGDDTYSRFSLIDLFTGTALYFLGRDLLDYDFVTSKVLVDCDGAASTIFLLVTITFFFCG